VQLHDVTTSTTSSISFVGLVILTTQGNASCSDTLPMFKDFADTLRVALGTRPFNLVRAIKKPTVERTTNKPIRKSRLRKPEYAGAEIRPLNRSLFGMGISTTPKCGEQPRIPRVSRNDFESRGFTATAAQSGHLDVSCTSQGIVGRLTLRIRLINGSGQVPGGSTHSRGIIRSCVLEDLKKRRILLRSPHFSRPEWA